MRVKRMSYKARIAARVPGDVSRARVEARREGVNIDVVNGWVSPPDVPNCMGPHPTKDNVWSNSPSLVLHAFDEGMVEKFASATVKWAIQDGAAQHGYAASTVRRMIDVAFASTYNERPLNSNVELNGRDAFQLFPHGVAGYLLDHRRLNAKWYGPLCDQLQFFFINSNLLTAAHKAQMNDLTHMIREITTMVRSPIRKDGGIGHYQAYIDAFVVKLIAYTLPHTAGECKSIKYHCARHWGEQRKQLGCAAMEYSLERALGDNFKRFWHLTNHGKHGVGKDLQLAAIVHRHQMVYDLCYHAHLLSSLRQGKNNVDQSGEDLLKRNSTVVLRGFKSTYRENYRCSFDYESRTVARIMLAKLRANTNDMMDPVTLAQTMRIPLQNRSVARGAPTRIEVLTLRARPVFFGKQRYDNVKMLCEMDPLPCGRRSEIAYARCVCFYRDCAGHHFVGVHWYEKAGRNFVDPKARLAKVKPMKANSYASYDIMPVGAILNGALLVRDRGLEQPGRNVVPQYWIRQSPRELHQHLNMYGIRRHVPGQGPLERDRL
jgi:hypothetical protein